jgi:hypothetical protein
MGVTYSLQMAWLLLRIPRANGATSMSGVLFVDGHEYVARSAQISDVCDALIANAPDTKPTLIFPLDGRHGLAGYVLSEATKRGWEFSRHVPPGHEEVLFDLDGADATADDPTARLQELGAAMGQAWNDDEIGESIGIGRQAITLCLKQFAAWHAYTFWIMSNYFQAAAGTGNEDNIREACNVVEYLLKQPRPAEVVGPASTANKLAELAQRSANVGNQDLANRLMDSARSLAE